MSGSPAPPACPQPSGAVLFHLATTSSGHLLRPPLGPLLPERSSPAALSTWSPCSASQASLRCLPLRSLIAPPAQPTLGFSGDLPAPLHLCSPGSAGPEQLACRGLGLRRTPGPWSPWSLWWRPPPCYPHWLGFLARPGACRGPTSSQTRAVYLSPRTLLHPRPTSFSSEVSGQSALGAPLPGARHSARPHILRT